jgi:anti-anti-sigma regulatory factor
MLRITQDGQKLILHGQLAGPWVNELSAVWNKSLAVVDLTNVTFVDEAGAEVLCSMNNAGVKFVARGVDTRQLLEDMRRKMEPARRCCLSWLSSDADRKD